MKIIHKFIIVSISFISFISLTFYLIDWNPHSLLKPTTTTTTASNVAIVTFLSTRSSGDTNDDYFNATRVLTYKLLRDPVTKTKRNIPFLVVVTKTVEEWKRDQLISDGASVVEVDYVPASEKMLKGEPRWIDQYTKLRIWQLTMFDRMLYIDSDMLIVRCLDGVFDDPASFPVPIDPPQDGLPASYLLAGSDDVFGENNPIPRPHSSTFNAGFFVFQPSLKMFRKYLETMSRPETYPTNVMEQGLLNHVHDKNGIMPWTRLQPGKWNVNWPNYRDYEYGVASLHDKWWRPGADAKLVDLWLNDLSNVYNEN